MENGSVKDTPDINGLAREDIVDKDGLISSHIAQVRARHKSRTHKIMPNLALLSQRIRLH